MAGTLKRLGLYIPQPEVETDERNPRGYYEPLWVAEFHKWLLDPIPVRTIDSRPNAGKSPRRPSPPRSSSSCALAGSRCRPDETQSSSRTPAPTGSTPSGSGWPTSSARS